MCHWNKWAVPNLYESIFSAAKRSSHWSINCCTVTWPWWAIKFWCDSIWSNDFSNCFILCFVLSCGSVSFYIAHEFTQTIPGLTHAAKHHPFPLLIQFLLSSRPIPLLVSPLARLLACEAIRLDLVTFTYSIESSANFHMFYWIFHAFYWILNLAQRAEHEQCLILCFYWVCYFLCMCVVLSQIKQCGECPSLLGPFHTS